MKNKKGIAFKRIIYGITGIAVLIILLMTIQPQLIVAQRNNVIDPASIVVDTANYKVTFIELGSVKCIPCKEMQPVLQSIEKKYGGQVKIIFHDVWTPEGKKAAKQFVFDVIPTQIFLDKSGKEYFRHEGFLPEKDLVKILKMKGVR